MVQVTKTTQGNRLTLLKQEVGEMARELILTGDASVQAVQSIVQQDGFLYRGPENSRVLERERKRQLAVSQTSLINSLDVLRKA